MIRTLTVVGPLSSWVKVTTPSTLEVPLRTATAFFVAATTVRGLGAVAEERERDWGDSLKDKPWKDEERREEAELDMEEE